MLLLMLTMRNRSICVEVRAAMPGCHHQAEAREGVRLILLFSDWLPLLIRRMGGDREDFSL